ncbi:MAG TPA: M23 family metallopeptidase [Gammaproteobacteria bacterium]
MTHASRPRSGILAFAVKGLVLTACGLALLAISPDGTSKSSELRLAPYQPRSAHHAYGYALALEAFRRPGAREWVLSAQRAISAPERVELPVELTGRFDAGRTDALGIAFAVRGGRRIYVDVEAEPSAVAPGADGRSPFVELFAAGDDGFEPVANPLPLRVRGADPVVQRLEVAALEPGEYVLRVQPEIGFQGRYRVGVRAAPLLAFPVEGVTTRAILSGFGAERDGGARSHRGVDIFAPRGTPALAAMDAFVSRVETTARGGNVVWLQPLFGDLRLYYAHLDTQLVRPGDFVLAGEIVGTVGNTGNAITTPPHLHFGVYVRRRGVRGGARDPYPFLD